MNNEKQQLLKDIKNSIDLTDGMLSNKENLKQFGEVELFEFPRRFIIKNDIATVNIVHKNILSETPELSETIEDFYIYI